MAAATKRQRFVYIMERTTNKSWESVLLRRKEIKLGISYKPKRRKMTVDRGIRGRIILLEQYKITNASTIEKELHQKYNEWNFVPKKALRGAGKTEFFRLTNKQIAEIKSYLSKLEKSRTAKPKRKIENHDWSDVIVKTFWISVVIVSLLKLLSI